MTEGMGLSKTMYDGRSGTRRYVELTAREGAEILVALRGVHKEVMRSCIDDAREILGLGSPREVVSVACSLFERRALASFSCLQEALHRKAASQEEEEEPLLATECVDCGDELSERARVRGFERCFLCFRKSSVTETA